jgi:cytochrome c-type biogenesis protein CcmH/NrfG
MSAVARRYFVRGRAYLRQGRWDDAQRELGAALELSPGFVEARVGYALALGRTDPPRALQSLRAGLARATRAGARRPLLVALADLLLVTGDVAGAEAALHEVAQLPGPQPDLEDRWARLHLRSGRFAAGVAALLAASRRG